MNDDQWRLLKPGEVIQSEGLNRVTHEYIEDGIVVSGRIGSAKKWADAYRDSVDPWQYDPIIASMLMSQMGDMYDACDVPSDLDEYEQRLNANRSLLETMDQFAVKPNAMKRLAEYEQEIRSRNQDEPEAQR